MVAHITASNDRLNQRGRNSRKVGERKLANLKSELRQTTDKNTKAFIRRDIKETKRAIKTTYAKGNTPAERAAAINFLNATSSSNTLYGGRYRVQNYMTQQQLNLATKVYGKDNLDSEVNKQIKQKSSYLDMESNPSRFSAAQVKIYFRMTQPIWEGRNGNRNKMIMKFLGVESLDQAVSIVLSQSSAQLALKIESGAINPNRDLTPEQRELYDNMIAKDGDNQKTGSPPSYLHYVTQFDVNETWENGVKVEKEQ